MKRKILVAILITLALCVPLALSGCGDILHPAKHVSTAEDLLLIKDGGKFVLDNDIDCEGKTWMGVSLPSNAELAIDGKGHKIHNVVISAEGNCFGLISSVDRYSSITIENLALEDFSINTNKTSGNSTLYIGGFVGLCNSGATFNNCYASGEIDVDINNSETNVGMFAGYVAGAKFENCLIDGSIDLHFDDFGFSKASTYVGGFLGRSTAKNYGGGYYADTYESCVSLASISVDTSLSMSWNTTTYVGGFVGYVGDINITNCISAPDRMYASTFYSDDVSMGGIQLIGTGRIGAFAAKADYVSSSSRNYYCNYFDENLTAEEIALECSEYENLNGTNIGTAVNLNKTVMLSEAFMSGDYSFTDNSGEEKEAYLQFDKEVWSFGYSDGGAYVLPRLKVFN